MCSEIVLLANANAPVCGTGVGTGALLHGRTVAAAGCLSGASTGGGAAESEEIDVKRPCQHATCDRRGYRVPTRPS